MMSARDRNNATMTLLEKLTQWQAQQARKEGVEGYRILPYKTLVELARVMPRNEMELLTVKGIGAIKARRYGAALLALLHSAPDAAADKQRTSADVSPALAPDGELRVYDSDTGEAVVQEGGEVFAVGDFLRALNVLMASHFRGVRVRGEVVDFRRNVSGHAYFQIKDKSGVMRVTVFRGAYDLSGVEIKDGVEIIVTGHPQHHAQYGFSFIGETVEYAGAGALKKAYDILKKKMIAEGLCDPARKRPVPDFVQRVGLITSRSGAAIGDFTTNLAPHGLQVSFVHSAVEGAHAARNILGALAQMRALAQRGRVEVLVLTRGGGSLESLQAFNNEHVVRAIADFPVPVVAGIGHERDETLATLVADVGVSTPTAAAKAVTASWLNAVDLLRRKEQQLTDGYDRMLVRANQRIERAAILLTGRFDGVLQRFANARRDIAQQLGICAQAIAQRRVHIAYSAQRMLAEAQRQLERAQRHISRVETLLVAHDPQRLLARGYAIVRGHSGIVRSVDAVAPGERLSVRVSDGILEATVASSEKK